MGTPWATGRASICASSSPTDGVRTAPRYGGPHRILLGGRQQEPNRRLPLEAGVIVALELRPHREETQVFLDGELVLDEATVIVNGGLWGDQVDRAVAVGAVHHVAILRPADHFVPRSQREAILISEIEGVLVFPEAVIDPMALGLVVVDLGGPVRLLAERPPPIQEDVVARHVGDAVVQGFEVRRHEGREHRFIAVVAVVVVALEGDAVLRAGPPVHAQAGVDLLPGVGGGEVGGIVVVHVEPFAVDAVGEVVADLAAVAGGGEALLVRAGAALEIDALGVLGVLGDDVDDAVDRIGAPDGAPGAADHLDPINVFEEHVLDFPKNAAKERVIDDPSVDHHQQIVGEPSGESPNGHGPLVGIDLRHFHAGHHAQHFRNGAGSGAADHFVGDNEDCRRGMAHGAGLPRYGRDGGVQRLRRWRPPRGPGKAGPRLCRPCPRAGRDCRTGRWRRPGPLPRPAAQCPIRFARAAAALATTRRVATSCRKMNQ